MLGATRTFFFAAGLCAWSAVASAQLPEQPYVGVDDHLTVSADIAATVAPPDDGAFFGHTGAFFNYTDYDHDALRNVRIRLLGEWRASPHFSILGELRAENRDMIDAAAIYLRWRPLVHHDFDIQIGRVPPVIGAFARHAYGRDNLVIGFPLAYQYLTSLRPDAQPLTSDDILRMRARGWRPAFPVGAQTEAGGVPLVSGFDWDAGVETHWHRGSMDYAAAITRGAPASPAVRQSRPSPNLSGRVAVTAFPGLVVGLSGAAGHWINQDLLTTFADTKRDSTQTMIGTDVEYGQGRTLVRGEWLRSRFDVPLIGAIGPLTATSGFVEGRYRFHPRWQASARAEWIDFSDIPSSQGVPTPWDAPVHRVELVLGYRAARNFEVRAGVQHNHRDGGRIRQRNYPALQVLYWF